MLLTWQKRIYEKYLRKLTVQSIMNMPHTSYRVSMGTRHQLSLPRSKRRLELCFKKSNPPSSSTARTTEPIFSRIRTFFTSFSSCWSSTNTRSISPYSNPETDWSLTTRYGKKYVTTLSGNLSLVFKKYGIDPFLDVYLSVSLIPLIEYSLDSRYANDTFCSKSSNKEKDNKNYLNDWIKSRIHLWL